MRKDCLPHFACLPYPNFFHHRVRAAVPDDFHRSAFLHHFAAGDDIEELVAESGFAAGTQGRNGHPGLAEARLLLFLSSRPRN